jgi:hypothetical protein
MRKLVLASMITLALVVLVGGVLAVTAATDVPQSTLARLGQGFPALHLGSSGSATDKTLLPTRHLNGKAGDDEERGTFCDGEEGKTTRNHPTGENLALRFDVTYAEIMKRFCGGRGFGEIALGYKIADVAGVAAEEVFAKRDEGLGWGQIKKEYDLKGRLPAKIKGPPKQVDDDQGNKNGKNNKGNKSNKGNKNKNRP